MTEPQQPVSHVSPPQPDKPLGLEEARAKGVCRICGKLGGGDCDYVEDEPMDYAHTDCLAREQAAAAERKEPAKVQPSVRRFRRVDWRKDGDSSAYYEVDGSSIVVYVAGNGVRVEQDSSMFMKNENFSSDDWIEQSLGEDWSQPEPSEESEPWEKRATAAHDAYIEACGERDQLKQQLAAANETIRIKQVLVDQYTGYKKEMQAEIEQLKKEATINCRVALNTGLILESERNQMEAERDKAQADLRASQEYVETLKRERNERQSRIEILSTAKVNWQCTAERLRKSILPPCGQDWIVPPEAIKEFDTRAEAIRSGSPPVAQPDERDARLAALCEAVGKLDEYMNIPGPITNELQDHLNAINAAADAASPRAKEFLERLEDYEQLSIDHHKRGQRLEELEERLAKAEAAAARGKRIEVALTEPTNVDWSLLKWLEIYSDDPGPQRMRLLRLKAALAAEPREEPTP